MEYREYIQRNDFPYTRKPRLWMDSMWEKSIYLADNYERVT